MVDWIGRLFQPEPNVMDGLLRLAGGDVDLLREAIRRAADGSDSVDLGKVVETITRRRAEPQPRPTS